MVKNIKIMHIIQTSGPSL